MRFAYIISATLVSISLAAVPVHAGGKDCPPGQAKKSKQCTNVVPQDDQKSSKHMKPGSKITDGHAVRDPSKYNLDPFGSYYRKGHYIYRVDRSTMKILDLMGRVQDMTK